MAEYYLQPGELMGFWVAFWVVLVGLAILMAAIVGSIARDYYAQSSATWFFASLFFTPVVALLMLMAMGLQASRESTRSCSNCLRTISSTAMSCPYCGTGQQQTRPY